MPIRIARHEESMANIKHPEWKGKTGPEIPLSSKGHRRAHERGAQIARDFPGFLSRARLFESPFLRVTQTMDGIIAGARLVTSSGKPLILQRDVDKRLGEINFGGEDWDPNKLSQAGGIWEHRFKSGESFAVDGLNNMASFISDLEDLIDEGQSDFFIVTHGWTILTLLVVWFNRSGNFFNAMENIGNGEFVTIARLNELNELQEKPVFTSSATRTGEWGVSGIRPRNGRKL